MSLLTHLPSSAFTPSNDKDPELPPASELALASSPAQKIKRWSMKRWAIRLKHMLHNDCCRYCFDVPVRSGLFCTGCRETLALREQHPVAADKGSGFEAYAATLMNPAMKKLLYPYKFYHRKEHALTLAHVLLDYWQAHPKATTNTWVVPIPSRWSKNHLNTIVREFGYAQNLHVVENILAWHRETQPQHKLTNRSQRFSNMRDALSICPYAWEAALETHGLPDQILVVDDLTTTGATFQSSHQAWQRWLKHQTLTIPVVHLALCHVPFQFRHHSQGWAPEQSTKDDNPSPVA